MFSGWWSHTNMDSLHFLSHTNLFIYFDGKKCRLSVQYSVYAYNKSLEWTIKGSTFFLTSFVFSSDLLFFLGVQKRKRTGKKQANMRRLKAKMAEIGEQQKRIKRGQMEIREKFEEIEFECDQLRKETLLISQQAACNQQRLNLMLKIVKAREDNNLSEADRLIQCLRLVSPDSP